jgi:diguanylate cyclase (GGDEF)-like protein
MEVRLFVCTNENGEPDGFWGVARKIGSRHIDKKLLGYVVYHDSLTELPNRAWLVDRLERMVKRSRIAEEKIALVLIDLVSFRLINDVYGYHFGSLLLKKVVELVEGTLRSTDLFVRMGSDDFAIVVGSQPIERSVISVLRRLLDLFERPFELDGKLVKLMAHFGVSVCPDDSEDANLLLDNAEKSIERLSKEQESAFIFNSRELDDQAHDRIGLEKALAAAIKSNEIAARYQPINEFLENGSVRMVALEAYVRWVRPDQGELLPSAFMDIADELGLIGDIDRKIYEIVLNDVMEWNKESAFAQVTINLSQKTLEDSSFAAWAIALAKAKNVSPQQIRFDAKCEALVSGAQALRKTVDALSDAGFSFCADDFGEGLVFLSKLKSLGIHAIKIAPKWLKMIGEDDDDTDSFQSLKSLEAVANTMGLEFTVAGVEDETLDRRANEAGSKLRQGFFYSKPIGAGEIRKYALGLK